MSTFEPRARESTPITSRELRALQKLAREKKLQYRGLYWRYKGKD